MAGALAIGFRSPPVPNKRHPIDQPHSIALSPISTLLPSTFIKRPMKRSMEAPGSQNELQLSSAKVSGDLQDKLRSASKEQQASTQASGCAVQAATTSDVAIDIVALEPQQSSTTQILIPSPILEPSNGDPVTDSTHAHSKQSCEVLETSVPTEQDTPILLNGTQSTENTEEDDAFEKSSNLVGDATNRDCHDSPELEPASTSPETMPESRREVYTQDAHVPESSNGHSNMIPGDLEDVAHTDCSSNPDPDFEEQAAIRTTSDSHETFHHQAISSRSQSFVPLRKADATNSRLSNRGTGQASQSRLEGDDSTNPHSPAPLSVSPRYLEIALQAMAKARDNHHSSAANSGSDCSNPKETEPDADSMPSTQGDTVNTSHNFSKGDSSSPTKVDVLVLQRRTGDQSVPTATGHADYTIVHSSVSPLIAATAEQESPTPRTSNTAHSKSEICVQGPTAGDPQDATDKTEHLPAISNDSNPDLQFEVHALPATTNSLPMRKTPPQQAILSQLKAERETLLASLASLPAVQVLIEERAAHEAEGMSNDDAPGESDIMTAANEMVKRHIKLLHQYNELKDVGQGLMGLIADQRGVRIAEVQETFGIGSQD